MGCGNSKMETLPENSFTMHILHLVKAKNNNDLRIVEKEKELCKLKEKLSLIDYAVSSNKKEFKTLFEKQENLKKVLFFVYFFEEKKKSVWEYSEVYKFIPYDELAKFEQKIVTKFYLFDISTTPGDELEQEEIVRQLHRDNDIIGKIIKVEKEKKKMRWFRWYKMTSHM